MAKNSAARLRACFKGVEDPVWRYSTARVKAVVACRSLEMPAYRSTERLRGRFNFAYDIDGKSKLQMARWFGDFYRFLRGE